MTEPVRPEAYVDAVTSRADDLAEVIRDGLLHKAASCDDGLCVLDTDVRKFGIDGYVDLVVVARLVREAIRADAKATFNSAIGQEGKEVRDARLFQIVEQIANEWKMGGLTGADNPYAELAVETARRALKELC